MAPDNIYRPHPRYAEGFPNQGNLKRSISVLSFTSLDNMRSTLSGLFTPLKLEEEEEEDDDEEPSIHDYEDYASKQKDDDLKKEKGRKRVIRVPNLSIKLLLFKFLAIFGLGAIFTYMAEGIVQEAKLSLLTVRYGNWVFKPNWSVTFGLVAIGLAVSYRLMDVRYPSGSSGTKTSNSSQFQVFSRYLAAFATLLLTMKRLLSTQSTHSFAALIASAITIWYVFDRSKNGFTVSCVMSIVGSITYYVFVDSAPFSLFETNPPEYQFRYWIPMILFSASTIVGNAGRLLF
ncbi:INSIG domain-containing protein [Schizosaccharomyces cryophilus OY26]|uniref:INSIG domain-containing protein n=1 Tax=Schizosaccharomyces cryophilus (strain OY26 / ATCC MYA-4695 / CBS 11777 / NBRC 106824 / NRRL Y48691) TaxID=653667 RepID=S9WZ57_SCHCR|nr:INSIG domain-containing protein [Schizosaccharomyces cryophilus OY26]EPY49987.1 INSIG domain-containing protein [Schizosaccharomyces cryophilus OY26]